MFDANSERTGKTYRFIGPTKLYITINKDLAGNIREVFLNAASSGSTIRSLCEALGKAVSIALQNEKRLLPRIIRSFQDDLSESQWHCSELSRPAKSIPDALSLVLAQGQG